MVEPSQTNGRETHAGHGCDGETEAQAGPLDVILGDAAEANLLVAESTITAVTASVIVLVRLVTFNR